MSDHSTISWTEATWNIVTGCSVISPGCKNCYAMKLAGSRLQNHPSRVGLTQLGAAGPVWTGETRFNAQWLMQPLEWSRARRIFVCAHGDLFHESVPDETLDQVFAVMALARRHTFQVLTKRATRMREYLTRPGRREAVILMCGRLTGNASLRGDKAAVRQLFDAWNAHEFFWPLPNVWLGASAEDQVRADHRLPELLATPAALRFASLEPLLAAVRLSEHGLHGGPGQLDWVIAGGESGSQARAADPDWFRIVRDECAAARVPFHFKQWGAWLPIETDCRGDGEIYGIADDGTERELFTRHIVPIETLPSRQQMAKLGAKFAGRLLDGVEHLAMPRSASQ